jgi:hypothetical protein
MCGDGAVAITAVLLHTFAVHSVSVHKPGELAGHQGRALALICIKRMHAVSAVYSLL